MSSVVLDALRSSMGIQSFPTKEIEFYNHKWTLRDTLPEETEFAWTVVNAADPPEQSQMFIYSTALLACGVCRIDGIPVYDVFGVEVTDKIVDPNIPPIDIRRNAITALFNFLRQEVPNRIVLELFTRYSAAVKMQGNVDEDAPEGAVDGKEDAAPENDDPLL